MLIPCCQIFPQVSRLCNALHLNNSNLVFHTSECYLKPLVSVNLICSITIDVFERPCLFVVNPHGCLSRQQDSWRISLQGNKAERKCKAQNLRQFCRRSVTEWETCSLWITHSQQLLPGKIHLLTCSWQPGKLWTSPSSCTKGTWHATTDSTCTTVAQLQQSRLKL